MHALGLSYLYIIHRRLALQTWKQRKGCNATHTGLIAAFESVGYKEYADYVRRLANINISTDVMGDGNCHRSLSTSPMETKECVQSLFLTDMPDDSQEGCIHDYCNVAAKLWIILQFHTQVLCISQKMVPTNLRRYTRSLIYHHHLRVMQLIQHL